MTAAAVPPTAAAGYAGDTEATTTTVPVAMGIVHSKQTPKMLRPNYRPLKAIALPLKSTRLGTDNPRPLNFFQLVATVGKEIIWLLIGTIGGSGNAIALYS